MSKVIVLGNGGYEVPFTAEGYETAVIENKQNGVAALDAYVDWADLIVFTGGTDVGVNVYGDESTGLQSPPDTLRDEKETYIYKAAREKGVPMVGICRGAQFLCAMNGGKLVQHLEGARHLTSHTIIDSNGAEMVATSSHHQLMVPDLADNHCHLLAYATLGVREDQYYPEIYYGVSGYTSQGEAIEPEVVLWTDTKCLGHQPHPEWMEPNAPYRKYFMQTVEELLKL